MMQTNGTDNREQYLKQWASRMVSIWEEKMIFLDTRDTGQLYNSLKAFIVSNAGGEITVIEHFFNYYGIYVDKGTGREFSRGNGGDIGITPNREPKQWFNPKFYYYTQRLAEKMAEISGEEFTYIMKNIIEGTE